MNVGDRFPITLDVEVTQVNDKHARLQYLTDNGTIVRFWYGVDSLPIRETSVNDDPYPRMETC